MTDTLPVLAVVVATRGGTMLDAALASVGWAAERAVLDPAGQVPASALPAGVRLGRDVGAVASLGQAPWMLLLGEEETASPALSVAVGGTLPGGPEAARPRLEVAMLGLRFALRHRPVRLARREHSRIVLDRALELALAGAPGPEVQLDAELRLDRGCSVAAAVDALEPDSRARAALLAQLGVHPSAATLIVAPLVALGRVLRARVAERAGLARWICAVFAAYRVVLTHARVWEWRHAQPAPLREVA